MSKSKILFQMSGSIACYKACEVVSQLVKSGHEVQVVCSPASLKFIGAATLEGLTGRPVLSDLFESGQMMEHIHLSRWCDLALVCPATANTINKLSQGLGEDLITTLFLAHDFKKPYIVIPAMNTKMYQHPKTQESIQKLKKMGVDVLNTNTGTLACGEEGEGRLLEPQEILKKIFKKLPSSTQPAKAHFKPRVLVTAGGTQEVVDGVRVLGNLSTGQTGRQIAESLARRGCDVHYVHSIQSPLANGSVAQSSFQTHSDLSAVLQALLKREKFDVVIHAAAVGDFSVDTIRIQGSEMHPSDEVKIPTADKIELILKKTPKIIQLLKKWSSNREMKVVGFKLTKNATSQEREVAVDKLFSEADVDWVVHNDLSQIDKGEGKHGFTLYNDRAPKSHGQTIEQLVQALGDIVVPSVSQVEFFKAPRAVRES